MSKQLDTPLGWFVADARVRFLDHAPCRGRVVANSVIDEVLLLNQDRSLWDYAQIQRGMTALEQAQGLGGGAKPYALQAAIAACHMRARTAVETDWDRIVLLYDALLQINPSIQRAIAMTKNLREQELLPNRLKQLDKAAFSV